jgi:hypothetical protein
MSAAPPPEYFFDRSLGKVTAHLLRDMGWTVHLIADYYPNNAEDVQDEDWIAEGCSRGWSLLTKDKKIRYRAHEFAALNGHLFCLANGNIGIGEMAARFHLARRRIARATVREPGGFWHVYEHGAIRRMDTSRPG